MRDQREVQERLSSWCRIVDEEIEFRNIPVVTNCLQSEWKRTGHFPEFLEGFLAEAVEQIPSDDTLSFLNGDVKKVSAVISEILGFSNSMSPTKIVAVIPRGSASQSLFDQKIWFLLRDLGHLRLFCKRLSTRIRCRDASVFQLYYDSMIEYYEVILQWLTDADIVRGVGIALPQLLFDQEQFSETLAQERFQRLIREITTGYHLRTTEFSEFFGGENAAAESGLSNSQLSVSTLADCLTNLWSSVLHALPSSRRSDSQGHNSSEGSERLQLLIHTVDALAVLLSAGRSFSCTDRPALAEAIRCVWSRVASFAVAEGTRTDRHTITISDLEPAERLISSIPA